MEIRADECPCTLNETELFDPIPKQIVLSSTREDFCEPTNGINDNTLLFDIVGSEEFIDLNDIALSVTVKITKTDGTNLAATDIIAPGNNWLHNMFSDIQLTVGSKVIEGGQKLYPYKAYFYNLLSHDSNTKRTQLAASGWYKDTAGKFDTNEGNNGFTTRQGLVASSATIQLYGPLLLDFFLQNRYLLPLVNLRLLLTRSSPEFQVMIKTATDVANRANAVNIKIEEANLHYRRVRPLPSLLQSIEENLVLQNAVYPIQRTLMTANNIAQGAKSITLPSLFNTDLPKLIFIALCADTAHTGSYTENPFNFEHFNVESIQLADSSGTAVFTELKTDFTGNKYAHAYMQLFKTMGMFNQGDAFDVTINEFKKGYAIYGFNLTPDQHASGHQQIAHKSTISLKIQFSTAPTKALQLIAMGVMDGRVEISKLREVNCSWLA